MPRCLTTYKRRSIIDWDRTGPLTCRHRRRCDCDRVDNRAHKTPAGSVSTHPPAPVVKPWENEEARLVMSALDPYPEAKAAFVAAVMAQYKVEI